MVEKPDKINIHSNTPCWYNVLLTWCDEMMKTTFCLWSSSPKLVTLIKRETSDNSPYKTVYKTSNCIYSQNCQSHPKESLRNCCSQKEPEETWQLNVMWVLNDILEDKKDKRWRLRQSEYSTDFSSNWIPISIY